MLGCPNAHRIRRPAHGASSSVTELEVLEGEEILGEKEDLTEGLSGGFTITLEKGTYTLRCTGGSKGDGTLTVTGAKTGA